MIRSKQFAAVILVFSFALSNSIAQGKQGFYFNKKSYTKEPIPRFSETRHLLPQPIFDEDTAFVSCYWKAWEIAFDNIYEPTPESGFVSPFIDASFNDKIFLWDMAFITMFANYGTPFVPAISGLDNFYAKQYLNGEIGRELVRETGEPYSLWINQEKEPMFSRYGVRWPGLKMPIIYKDRKAPMPPTYMTLEAFNHPILAWAEMESFKITADTARLSMVWEPLVKYYQMLQKYLMQGNGLYITDWASMDNSPRNGYLMYGGTAIDISSEMVLFARNLSTIAGVLGKHEVAEKYDEEADLLSELINEKMWSTQRKFYVDLTLFEYQVPVKTVAGFWPLVAGVATEQIADTLVRELENPKTFNRKHRVPTLASGEDEYDPEGDYWSGSVWAPTNMMIVRGLEKYGYEELAYAIAMDHLRNVVEVFKTTGTIWENYAPDSISPGSNSRPDFVGWSGIAPISFFIEYGIGIKVNAPERKVEWRIKSDERVGLEQLWFDDTTVDMICERKSKNGKRTTYIQSNGEPFELKIIYGDREIIREIKEGDRFKLEL